MRKRRVSEGKRREVTRKNEKQRTWLIVQPTGTAG
jgi:hypothetical protein